MKTRTIAFGLMTSAIAHVACKKADSSGGDGSRAPSAPSADALAPGFKNTAKNSAEVGNKFKAFNKSAKSADMGLGSSTTTSTNLASVAPSNLLQGIDLKSFNSLSNLKSTQLSDSSTPSDGDIMDALMDIAVNDDCGAAIKKLNTFYESKYQSISSDANTAIKYDGSLPEGVTKSSNDQYAAIYSQVGTYDNQPVAFSVGYGANDDKTISAVTMDGKLSDPENEDKKIDAHIEMITVATASKKLIEESNIITTQSGMKVKYVVATTGGDSPSINIAQDLAYQGKSAIGNIKISKTSTNTIEIQGTETKDGQTENSSMKLSADASGKCVAAKK